ncbi:MAG: hypothetical protein Q8T03_02785 [Bacteroidota bacterium]|nr:hypothetical protein [Bacteroidota bacterium]
MPTQTGHRIELIDSIGLFKIVANKDEPKTGIYYVALDYNWNFELRPGYDYVVIPIEDKWPYKPIIAPGGKLMVLNIYSHQIEKIHQLA